jgi:hypothetical protein
LFFVYFATAVSDSFSSPILPFPKAQRISLEKLIHVHATAAAAALASPTTKNANNNAHKKCRVENLR